MRKAKTAPLETVIVRQCLDYLQLRRIPAWRNNTTGVYDPRAGKFRKFTGMKGVADILGLLPPAGRLLAVECKRPGGKTSEAQRAFLDAIEAAGGLAIAGLTKAMSTAYTRGDKGTLNTIAKVIRLRDASTPAATQALRAALDDLEAAAVKYGIDLIGEQQEDAK